MKKFVKNPPHFVRHFVPVGFTWALHVSGSLNLFKFGPIFYCTGNVTRVHSLWNVATSINLLKISNGKCNVYLTSSRPVARRCPPVRLGPLHAASTVWYACCFAVVLLPLVWRVTVRYRFRFSIMKSIASHLVCLRLGIPDTSANSRISGAWITRKKTPAASKGLA